MKRIRTHSPAAAEEARLLGENIRVARRQHLWTLQELADRVGVSTITMMKVERGDLTVGLGIAFEAAVISGVPLFTTDRSRLRLEMNRLDDRLALLPDAVRKKRHDNDF